MSDNSTAPADKSAPSAERFGVSPFTLFVDRFMNFFIRIGGAGIIAAVFGILIFITSQVLPLFHGASTEPLSTLRLGAPAGAVIGMDEEGELPFHALPTGEIVFHNAKTAESRTVACPLPANFKPSLVRYDERSRKLLFADAGGVILPVLPGYKTVFEKAGATDGKIEGRIQAEPSVGAPINLGEGAPLRDFAHASADSREVFVTLRGEGAEAKLEVVTVTSKKSIGGKSTAKVGEPETLPGPVAGDVSEILISTAGDSIFVCDKSGAVHWFHDEGEGFAPTQKFSPFNGAPVAKTGFIFGDVSLSFSSATGENTVWSIYQQKVEGREDTVRRWGPTKSLPATPSAPTQFAHTMNNKCYLLAGDGFASLRHSTTEKVRTDIKLDFKPVLAGVSHSYKFAWFLDSAGDLRRHEIHDPHPETGWGAFFGKIWYEGASKPEHTWQATSGNDDFEPKLSIVPLLFGSIKGTIYSLIFAVPVALLAALYTSQFMRPETRKIIKPAIELMASLPSVVLGFLGALWLAPRFEYEVPGIFLACLALPAVAMLFGYFWARLPKSVRIFIGPGNEYLALIPIALVSLWLAWSCGPVFEKIAFAGDFPAWWRASAGAYEQRNCLIVGFVMGFAVIPIIFTIAEDSLGNVPKSLISASLALGASRWQTSWLVVLPTASAGIFSALMIGLGRAVGETMIVLMATGNTPIMEWNIFNGMRTASANIATELPEAAEQSTHYRAIFLCACCLFLFTFLLNTLAETLRQHLREKYKVV